MMSFAHHARLAWKVSLAHQSKERVLARRRLLTTLMRFALLSFAGVLCAGWMCMQHIPGWYQPLYVSTQQLDLLQDNLEQTFDAISGEMADGEAFTVSMTARQLNELLALQQARWPAATDWMEPHLSAPHAVITPDHIALGVRCTWNQLQSIFSIRLYPAISKQELVIDIRASYAGSLRMPTLLLTRQVRPAASDRSGIGKATEKDAGVDLHDLTKQLQTSRRLRMSNEFEWPNGDIPFSITAVALDDNRLTLSIQPLLN